MARFLKFCFISITLIGMSACESGDSKESTYFSTNSHSVQKSQRFSYKPDSSTQEDISYHSKTLNAQSTTGTSNLSASWDMDNNGTADALTDGLLLLRYAFGLRGSSLIKGVIAEDSSLSLAEIEAEIEATLLIADIDGDGQVDALTDGLILLRHLFGLSGDSLVFGAISAEATRSSVIEITDYLISYMPVDINEPSTVTI